ncbi:MAG: family 65 glycosyl hydrolase, partial [Propionibacteriales bacterium]
MRRVSDDPMDRSRFLVDTWRLTETKPSDHDQDVTETLFAVGNGYLGMRGNPDEGGGGTTPGTFANGFHETWPISHAEDAFGFARTGQTIVTLPDSTAMQISVDGEALRLANANLTAYERSLDFREGQLLRDITWRTSSGKRVRVRSSRMVSFTDRHLVLYETSITILDGNAKVAIASQIVNQQGDTNDEQTARDVQHSDPRRAPKFRDQVLQPVAHQASGGRMALCYRTAASKMTVAVAAEHSISTDGFFESELNVTEHQGMQRYLVETREDQPIVVRKAVAYHTAESASAAELMDHCANTLDRVTGQGFEPYWQDQRDWLAQYWRDADVQIGGKPEIQQAVRWCLFQLAQASARSEGQGIPAKGLTGSGYEGHYFWDTEIYLLPFLTYTNPQVARDVLRYRVRQLPKARERAKVMATDGALFPWRTINGEEASAYYPAGTAQFHIDADIAHAFTKYREVTGDTEFMYRQGAAVLAETARMWADLGFWRRDACGRDSFEIHRVTGPDEYTAVVNNNLYTNVMARANLREAASLMRELSQRDPDGYRRLAEELRLDDSEIDSWERCAEAMLVPFDDTLGVHPQDDAFLTAELWDLNEIPRDRFPLLLHYHPLVIYRMQVLKQADVVLALLLQGDQFSPEQKRADFEYYDPITTGDSTLSGAMQAIIAAEVG